MLELVFNLTSPKNLRLLATPQSYCRASVMQARQQQNTVQKRNQSSRTIVTLPVIQML